MAAPCEAKASSLRDVLVRFQCLCTPRLAKGVRSSSAGGSVLLTNSQTVIALLLIHTGTCFQAGDDKSSTTGRLMLLPTPQQQTKLAKRMGLQRQQDSMTYMRHASGNALWHCRIEFTGDNIGKVPWHEAGRVFT